MNSKSPAPCLRQSLPTVKCHTPLCCGLGTLATATPAAAAATPTLQFLLLLLYTYQLLLPLPLPLLLAEVVPHSQKRNLKMIENGVQAPPWARVLSGRSPSCIANSRGFRPRKRLVADPETPRGSRQFWGGPHCVDWTNVALLGAQKKRIP